MKHLLIFLLISITNICFSQEKAPYCDSLDFTEFESSGDVPKDFTGQCKICSLFDKVQVIANYENGVLNGEYIKYESSTGELEEKGQYVNGEKDGEWFTQDILGEIKLPVYENGKVVKYNKTEAEKEKEASIKKGLWLIGGGALILILSIVIISVRTSKRKKEEAAALAERQRIEKQSLIDSLEELKNEISNFDEFVTELSKHDLETVRNNVQKAFNEVEMERQRVIREKELIAKYGEEIAMKIINQEYFLGMTEEQLIEMRGNPSKTETEVLKTKTNVIYIYGNKSSGDIFTFVDGKLDRYKDR